MNMSRSRFGGEHAESRRDGRGPRVSQLANIEAPAEFGCPAPAPDGKWNFNPAAATIVACGEQTSASNGVVLLEDE
jgi:hypothetical protein